jgi:catechol 2,3-dioxygenase-like lactoylglutathione lyase family enzyme
MHPGKSVVPLPEDHCAIKEQAMAIQIKTPKVATSDLKLEAVVIPVADVDRSKQFYEKLGWRLDADFLRPDGSRAVQLTPPGSPASIQLGKGPVYPRYLIVGDIEAARAELMALGVEVSDIFHPGNGPDGRLPGLDPERKSYSSLATFTDPDGNFWLLQEVTQRLPGRVDPHKTEFSSSAELSAALRRAAAAHGEHEKRTGGHDEAWADWYAEYIVREQAGQQLPT